MERGWFIKKKKKKKIKKKKNIKFCIISEQKIVYKKY